MLKGVYSVPRGVPFLAALARGLLAETQGDPLALATYRILLPNRRSVRALRSIFLAETDGQATLLPRMLTLGDIDGDVDMQIAALLAGDALDIPSPLTNTERVLQLSRMVQKKDATITAAQALALAKDLAALLNELYVYNVDASCLATLHGGDYAEHWQQTLRFLDIITTLWPQYLQSISRSDPMAYRLACLSRLTQAWQNKPPLYPVVMAGVARAEPAAMALAHVVKGCGAVLLPAFDTTLPAESWLHLDIVHPDALLRDVIDGLGVVRTDVKVWPTASVVPQARINWLSLALQPAALTANWQGEVQRTLERSAIDGIDIVPCADEAAEAQTIALLVRGALEKPQQTVAVVTPDRALARRVAALLKRWNIEADDSSGQPLLLAPLGIYLQLVAAAANPLAGVHDVLALLKHPLCGLGMATGDKARVLAILEAKCVRGHYPAAGMLNFCDHIERVSGTEEELKHVATALRAAFTPYATLLQQNDVCAKESLHAHLLAAEKLAATNIETGEQRLWIGREAEVASTALQELGDALTPDFTMQNADYAPWLAQLLGSVAVRVPYGLHPRVTISGIIESRLQQADVMIVAGLNEGVWPALPAANPWLNRTMRHTLGLPDSETHITQQAHDFISAASASTVYLTRALRSGGVPTVPARWLMRLQATLVPLGLDKEWQARGAAIAAWSTLIDKPSAPVPLAKAPAPQPPAAVRPRSAYVTDIERLMRDPYAFYARNVLGLRALDALTNTPNAAERGRYVHNVLATFLKHVGHRPLAPVDWDVLQKIATDCLQPYAHVPGIAELWGTWIAEVAVWFWEEENKNRPLRLPQVLEGKGERVFSDMGFTLKAKADRVDVQQPNKTVVLDYKTGQAPTQKDVTSGASPQLALEALIAATNGFGVPTTQTEYSGEYWHIAGTLDKCKIEHRKLDLQATEDGLRALVSTYLLTDTPFTALPRAARDYNDYKHLARTAEWAFADDDVEGEVA